MSARTDRDYVIAELDKLVESLKSSEQRAGQAATKANPSPDIRDSFIAGWLGGEIGDAATRIAALADVLRPKRARGRR